MENKRLLEEMVDKFEVQIPHCVSVLIGRLKQQRRLTNEEEIIVRPHEFKKKKRDRTVLKADEVEDVFKKIEEKKEKKRMKALKEKTDDDLDTKEWRKISQGCHPDKFNQHKYYRQAKSTR